MDIIDRQNGLTASQVKAACLLACGMSIEQLTSELQVDRSTLWRWRKIPTFQVVYDESLRLWKEEFTAGFRSRQIKAFSAIDRALESEEASLSYRAAVYVLDHLNEIQPKDYDIHKQIREATTKGEIMDPEFLAGMDWSYWDYDKEKYSEFCAVLQLDEEEKS